MCLWERGGVHREKDSPSGYAWFPVSHGTTFLYWWMCRCVFSVFVGMEYSNNSSTKTQKFWFQNYANAWVKVTRFRISSRFNGILHYYIIGIINGHHLDPFGLGNSILIIRRIEKKIKRFLCVQGKSYGVLTIVKLLFLISTRSQSSRSSQQNVADSQVMQTCRPIWTHKEQLCQLIQKNLKAPN